VGPSILLISTKSTDPDIMEDDKKEIYIHDEMPVVGNEKNAHVAGHVAVVRNVSVHLILWLIS
jgi:hypothetical protein